MRLKSSLSDLSSQAESGACSLVKIIFLTMAFLLLPYRLTGVQPAQLIPDHPALEG